MKVTFEKKKKKKEFESNFSAFSTLFELDELIDCELSALSTDDVLGRSFLEPPLGK